jgi:hypothetical protein
VDLARKAEKKSRPPFRFPSFAPHSTRPPFLFLAISPVDSKVVSCIWTREILAASGLIFTCFKGLVDFGHIWKLLKEKLFNL